MFAHQQEHISRYPKIAADILCADIERLYTQIVNDEELLHQLFHTVHSPLIVDDIRGGHWIRIMTMVLFRKPLQVCASFFQHSLPFAASLLFLPCSANSLVF